MNGFQIVVCGSLVPDPLQTLEPVTTPQGPGLKNETMLPSVLDPWSAHALYEAANLAKQAAGSKVDLVGLGPKAKLQQLRMTVAQKVPFELGALNVRIVDMTLQPAARRCLQLALLDLLAQFSPGAVSADRGFRHDAFPSREPCGAPPRG